MTDNAERKYAVLLVEDDKFMVRLYQARLTSEGFAVDVAMNGDECLERVAQSPPDLILLDLMLPLMNGFEVLKHLKADEKTSGIPVIVFSNRSDSEDIKKAKELGAADFLIKVSTRPEEVTRRILQTLRGKETGPRMPGSYHLRLDWNDPEAEKMVKELELPIEYRDGKCVAEVIFEAVPEHSHDEPWIVGHFIIPKKN